MPPVKAIEQSTLQKFNLMKETLVFCPAFLIALTINFDAMLYSWFMGMVVLIGKGAAAVIASIISRLIVDELHTWTLRRTHKHHKKSNKDDQ